MPLKIDLHETEGMVLLHLEGELDTATAPQMAPVMEGLVSNPPAMLVLHLKQLDYISSAGLRFVFQMKRLMKSTGGQFMVSEPSPQVRKVFDIVKAVPVQSVFASAEELDAYLDKMQRKVSEQS